MNNEKFMAYLLENNEKARLFLVNFIVDFYYHFKQVNLKYVGTEIIQVKHNDEEEFEVPLFTYDLEMKSDGDMIKTNLMISNSVFVHGYDVFIGTFNPYSTIEESYAFAVTITDHFTSGNNHLVIRNGFDKGRSLDFKIVNIFVKDIQLDYLNEAEMEQNKSSLIYQFLYLLKYNKPYREGNDLIDSIIETYNKYLKEYGKYE